MHALANQIQDMAQRLHLLQLCLKGDVRVWSRTFEEGLHRANPPLQLDWDNLKEALEIEFMKTEDPDKVRHEVQDLQQRKSETIDDYIRKFSLTWECLCRALEPQMALNMMKKDEFLAGL